MNEVAGVLLIMIAFITVAFIMMDITAAIVFIIMYVIIILNNRMPPPAI